MNKGSKRLGYTLLEAMVSVVLLAVGIVSVITAYTALSRSQRTVFETEQMQRLAQAKYDELVATEALQTQSLNGDFSDFGNAQYLWDAAVDATGTENLSAVTVTVQPREGDSPMAVVSGIVFQPPQTTAPVGATP